MTDATSRGERIDVGALVTAWEQRQGEPNRHRPDDLLFPHLDRLHDSDIQEFYDALKKQGYEGRALDTVDKVRQMQMTDLPPYHLGLPSIPLTRAGLYDAYLSSHLKG